MGRREVTIYTCDGCRAQSTLGRDETPRGYSEVALRNGTAWLCTVCYGAVEWVARFQGVTVPPTIYGEGTSASLRKPTEPES
jgi:hypothetical protein